MLWLFQILRQFFSNFKNKSLAPIITGGFETAAKSPPNSMFFSDSFKPP
jgi:hypothetical protein